MTGPLLKNDHLSPENKDTSGVTYPEMDFQLSVQDNLKNAAASILIVEKENFDETLAGSSGSSGMASTTDEMNGSVAASESGGEYSPDKSLTSSVEEENESERDFQTLKSHLSDAVPSKFPCSVEDTTESLATQSEICVRPVGVKTSASAPFSEDAVANLIRATWALLLATYHDSTDILYECAFPATEENPAHTAYEIPVRVRLSEGLLISKYVEEQEFQWNTAITAIESYVGRSYSAGLDFDHLLVFIPAKAGSDRYEAMQRYVENSTNHKTIVECAYDSDQVLVTVKFDRQMLEVVEVDRMLECFEHIFRQLSTQDRSKALDEIEVVSPASTLELFESKANFPATTEATVHSFFDEQVLLRPNAQAVLAWDGSFTYKELDILSAKLALQLQTFGDLKDTLIPIACEKSRWMIVAIMGVIRAGGAYVALDPAHPKARLEFMLEDTEADFILASPKHHQNAAFGERRVVIVSETTLAILPDPQPELLRKVDPRDAAYAIFTSGTTGRAKGFVIEHRSYCTGAFARAKALQRDETSRVLQYASYSFDPSVEDILLTLMVGGTICTPSESDRLNNISGFMAKARVNFANLTPAVADMIDPDCVPSLEVLCLSGDRMTLQNIKTWANRVKLLNAWGASECSIKAVVSKPMNPASSPNNIGHSIDSNILWVVHRNNHDKLMPVGAVGEILIEGPTIGRGYLHNEELSAKTFIGSPAWLAPLRPHSRLYKTGDLGYVNRDCSLTLVGRKDTQIKILGQRIELSEIEIHLRRLLTQRVCVEAVKMKGQDENRLAAFIELGVDAGLEETGDNLGITPEGRELLDEAVSGLEHRLAQYLPSYMIPTAFVPLLKIPITVNGKIDRRQLRELASQLSPKALSGTNDTAGDRQEPSTVKETHLLQLWASVLRTEEEALSVRDNFFHVGGDSLLAMKLAAAARLLRYRITVEDIFKYRVLTDMASAMESFGESNVNSIEPFELVGRENLGELFDQASMFKGISEDMVEDMYPATPLQEGILVLSLKDPRMYISQFIWSLGPSVNISLYRTAWEEITRISPILRTRLVRLKGHQSTMQLVLQEKINWKESESLPQYLREDKEEEMLEGQPLVRHGIVRNNLTGSFEHIFTAHHSVYDGRSRHLVLEQVQRAYYGLPLLIPDEFSVFVKYRENIDMDSCGRFWSELLENAPAPVFPVPETSRQLFADHKTTKECALPKTRNSDITLGTIITTAWALLVARYSENASDVIFGTVRSGGNSGIEPNGPTITTVPVRIQFSPSDTLAEVFRNVQGHYTSSIPFEHFGLQNIQRLSDAARVACGFQSLLVIQQPTSEWADGVDTDYLHLLSQRDDQGLSYAISMNVTPTENGVSLLANYDPNAVDTKQMERILNQFSHLLNQLCVDNAEDLDNIKVLDLELTSPEDKKEIRSWIEQVPESSDMCLHEFVLYQCSVAPNDLAISGWDGDFTYRELYHTSAKLAFHLMDLGIGTGRSEFVPLAFEHSKWMIVGQLAVMMTGAAIVPIDPSHPIQRIQQLVKGINASHFITSPSLSSVFEGIEGLIELDSTLIEKLPLRSVLQLPKVSSEAIAVVIHTSGSTGTPKGILMSHKGLCTSFELQSKDIDIRPRSRVLQYSAYTFDHSLSEIYTTYISGSCICIPSEEQRANELVQVMQEMKITLAWMTPTVARLFSPEELPDLEILYLGGEAVTKSLIDTWTPTKRLVAGYGPAECSMCCYMEYSPSDLGHSIGRMHAGICWLVNPNDSEVLAPIGTIGELLYEGPMLAVGYLNNPTLTEKSFIKAPTWLQKFDPSGHHNRRLYKSGDLVRFNTDGSFTYHGRKDTQVKIRGQRVEIGEVEHQLQLLLPRDIEFAVEVVTFADGDGSPSLAALISIPNSELSTTSTEREAHGLLRLKQLTAGLEDSLLQVLPKYMVPRVYIPLYDGLPLNTSRKVDRLALRKIASKITMQELASFAAPENLQATSTPMEKSLQSLWATTLAIDDPSMIGSGSSFFRLGGDSIASMRLVAAARVAGVAITVKKIFDNPVLSAMAEAATYVSAAVHRELRPFELLDAQQVDALRKAACQHCDLKPELVEDIFPCTPLQEGLMALTMKNPGTYVSQLSFELPYNLDIERFQNAWIVAAQTCAKILRTRIFDAPTMARLMQVVVGESIRWQKAHNLQEYLETDKATPMEIGDVLNRFAIIQEREQEEAQEFLKTKIRTYFVWTTHHATNDGWSRERLLQAVEQIYHGGKPSIEWQFQNFILNIVNADQQASKDFWADQLHDAPVPSFPTLPYLGYQPSPNASFVHSFKSLGPAENRSDIALPTRVRAAWSLLVSTYVESEDVVFGVTNNGRAADVPGIDAIIGPTFATVPIRMRVPKSQPIPSFLEAIQAQASSIIEHEHFGLQYIQQINDVCRAACEFQTLFLVQVESDKKSFLGAKELVHDIKDAFHSFALGLECRIKGTELTVHVEFDSAVLSELEVRRLVCQFEHIFHQLWYDKPDLRVSDIDLVSPNDLRDIDTWNHEIPKTTAACLHHIFHQRACERPQSVAISAWDGEISYQQLDNLSNQLAIHIIGLGLGVGPEISVLLCFEKSLYTIVTLLAVLKAGGVCVMLDTSLPAERRNVIRRATRAPLILLSAAQSHLSTEMNLPSVVVDANLFTALPPPSSSSSQLCTSTKPSNAAFLVFTSGSTGEPKGIVVEHQAAVSSVLAIGDFIEFGIDTRMLQFSSYNFDACYGEIFTTLLHGGALCVLSEDDRNNNLVGAINSFKVDRLFFPPTVVSYLRPEDVPHVKILACGGERMTESVLREWAGKLKLFNTYGPAETTIMCSARRDLRADDSTGDIGRGNKAALLWIVDRDDHNKLAIIGTSGELLIEGPTLARGYLNDDVKTQAAYIENPTWVSNYDWQSITSTTPRRFYRSGDIAKYNPDGSLHIMGRRDTQLKIRGQRVELGEIEVQLQGCLNEEVDVAVEGIQPGNGSGSATLVAFITFLSGAVSTDTTTATEIITSDDVKKRLMDMVVGIDSRLSTVLPSYMIPSAYLPVTRIPKTNTLKTDHKKLREIASTLSIQELSLFSTAAAAKREPESDMEKILHSIWMEVLHLPADQISADDSFFRIGGDSVAAMKVVSSARARNVQLKVDQIFAKPIMSELALVAKVSVESATLPIEPFALIDCSKWDLELIKEEASIQCELEPKLIQDIYPCSPLQTALMALSAKASGLYLAHFVFKLPESLDVALYQKAWNSVINKTPILRTSFFQTTSSMMQVVSGGEVEWSHGDNLQDFLHRDRSLPINIGKRLSRYAIVENTSEASANHFILTLHRAVYDAHSLEKLFSSVNKTYLGTQLADEPFIGYNSFIQHIENLDQTALEDYWRSQMADAPVLSFPALPTISYQPATDSKHSLDMTLPPRRQSEFTLSTAIRAAWALLLARYSDDVEDVVFGVTLSGRTVDVPGVNSIVGPTTAVVPLRIRLNRERQSIGDLLKAVQTQATEMMSGSMEQYGLHNIRNLSEDIQSACNFQTLLMVEQDDTHSKDDDLGISEEATKHAGAFHTYALSLDCHIVQDQVRVGLEFDSNVLDIVQMQRFLHQFQHVLYQLISVDNGAKKLADVELTSGHDIAEIIHWNANVDKSTDKCVHQLFEERASLQPDAPAICSWDGNVSYKQLNDLSTELASYVKSQGVGPNSLVPLVFEKSIWTVVTMLAVLKAGGASVALDPKHPGERLKGLVEDVGSNLVFASRQWAAKANGLAEKVIVIDATIMQTVQSWKSSQNLAIVHDQPQMEVKPHHPAFILFTSGSTGKPKGIIIEHRNFSSSINGHASVLRYGGPGSRNLQFTAYTSDVSIGEIFTSLAVGACVCIPSDEQRMNGLADAMEQMRVNWAFLTPSVASLLHPSEVPSLKTLLFGGETATVRNIDTWAPAVYLINSFGPAECSIWTHCNPGISIEDSGHNIGFGIGCNAWITDPADHNKLAPIGTIGELVVEGPNVAAGYLNNPEKTKAAFIDPPKWVSEYVQRPTSNFYAMGDLVRYLPDGKLHYFGRRDHQVKLRGQRVELGEIEHQLRQTMPNISELAVEMVRPAGGTAAPMLIAFISVALEVEYSKTLEVPVEIATSDVELSRYHEAMEGVHTRIPDLLPNHMIPSAYIPLRRMPFTASAKTDRSKLQSLSRSLAIEQVSNFALRVRNRVIEPPATETEKLIHQLWSQVLNIAPDSFGRDDHFFRVSGDSIMAMRLVALAHSAGLDLTVESIFMHPTLSSMALATTKLQLGEEELQPFELIEDVSALLHEASLACEINEDEIEDIYPVTALQEGLLALAQKEQGSYMAQFAFEIPADIDMGRLRAAWETAFQQVPILRTRLFQSSQHGTLQVVARGELRWRGGLNKADYLEKDRATGMRMGEPLSRFAIVEDRILVFTAHHAIYDGWSVQPIYKRVEEIYHGLNTKAPIHFNKFIKYVTSVDKVAAEQFWREQLANSPPSIFPTKMTARNHKFQEAYQKLNVDFSKRTGSEFTGATLIRTALALLLARYSDIDDVVFGATNSGRAAPVQDIYNIAGPTLSTSPVRVAFTPETLVNDLLSAVQIQSLEITRYEQMGLQNIRRLSSDAKIACDFKTLLVIQNPEDDENNAVATFLGCPTANEEFFKPFHTYPLVFQCTFSNRGFSLQLNYDSSVLPMQQAERMLEHFAHLVQLLNVEQGEKQVHELDMMVESDYSEIRGLNEQVIEPVNMCLHQLFEHMVRDQPESMALTSWDGQLTYEQLDNLSSTVASKLISLGVATGSIIPISFEKSQWAIISILGILKAGAAYCPLDSKHPSERLREIITEVNAQVIITSDANQNLFSKFGVEVLQISSSSLDSFAKEGTNPQLKDVKIKPEHPAYCLFTSGSSGKPKGVITSHGAISTSVMQHGVFGFNKASRVLQFSAYTFDISVVEIFSTLAHGACICAPSEDQRLDELVQVMNDMEVTLAILTPSFANIVRPDQLPHLEILILGAEPIRKDLIQTWAGKVRLLNGYGVTEASVCNMICEVDSPDFSDQTIGTSIGSLSWIVDSTDHNKLVPVGFVGELAIEGPILAEGYLNDPVKTATAFVEDAAFFASFTPPTSGSQKRRLYKTGDLVRYKSNGWVDFIGRKDTQIKLNGLRIELGEIEYQVRKALQGTPKIVVEVVTPGGRKENPTIALFLSYNKVNDDEKKSSVDTSSALQAINPEVMDQISSLDAALQSSLPAYMIPTLCYVLNSIPLTTSGKVDRRSLRKIAVEEEIQFTLQDPTIISELQRVSTEEEIALQGMWATLLSVEVDLIGKNSSFFRLGGDSLVAVKLVSKAREHGLQLSVAVIFDNPTLGDMALAMTAATGGLVHVLPPFSLLDTKIIGNTLQEASRQCNISVHEIEDMFPTIPLQEGMMGASLQDLGTYNSHFIYRLSPSLDMTKFKQAWMEVISRCSIMRTRIVHTTASGFMQVVTRTGIEIAEVDDVDLEQYKKDQQSNLMGLGMPLYRLTLLGENGSKTSDRYFVLTMHHAAYDGWSIPKLWRNVQEAYYDTIQSPLLGVNHLISYLQGQSPEEGLSFWKSYLHGSAPPSYPALPYVGYRSIADSEVNSMISLPTQSSSNSTLASTLQAAWGLLLSLYEGSQSVTFGVVVSGRTTPVPGIEDMIGSTMANFPFRVSYSPKDTVDNFLENTQKSSVDIIPYQHVGIQNIRKASPDAKAATALRTLLVVQGGGLSSLDLDLSIGIEPLPVPIGGVYTFPITVTCTQQADGISVNMSYDSRLLDNAQIHKLMGQFEHLVVQLASLSATSPQTTLKEVELINSTDLAKIHSWHINDNVKPNERTLHSMVHDQAVIYPSATAVSSWDGEMTYGELDDYSDRLAQHLISIGVVTEDFVAFSFEKSVSSIVVILAILKAGGVWAPLNSAHPKNRLQSLMKRISSRLLLTTPSLVDIFSELTDNVLVVTKSFLENLPPLGPGFKAPAITPDNAAYIMFTSGSTGIPKGVVVEHRAACSVMPAHALIQGNDSDSRYLQFTNFTWDVCVGEIFANLIAGGCLCLPSEHDRVNNLMGAMKALRVNQATLTPTVASVLRPDEVQLKTLSLGGEVLTQELVNRWAPCLKLINMYGPTECTVWCAGRSNIQYGDSPANIGKGLNCSMWIVDSENYNRLMPIGTVGEIFVDGPVLARGYLNDSDSTAKVFIQSPAWAMGRNKVHRRLYATGDLGVCNQDGTIQVLGRTDAQVKLNGQRVNLGEIDFHLHKAIGVPESPATEVIKLRKRDNPLLVVFMPLSSSGSKQQNVKDVPQILQTDEIQTTLKELVAGVEKELSKVLPEFMIPHFYIPVNYIPTTANDKIDHKALHKLCSDFTFEELSGLGVTPGVGEVTEPETEMGMTLRSLWAKTLEVEESTISKNDRFSALGGDSMAAVRLVSLARSSGLRLTVDKILLHQVLDDMVEVVELISEDDTALIPPFSLLNGEDIEVVKHEAASGCGIDMDSVEDIYPATPHQIDYLKISVTYPGVTTLLTAFEIPEEVDLERLKAAWELTVKSHAVLRTRIISIEDGRWLQIVQKDGPIQWRNAPTVQSYFNRETADPIGPGKLLSRAGFVVDPTLRKRYFITTACHSTYDAWSYALLFATMERAYSEKSLLISLPEIPNNRFVRFLQNKDSNAQDDFWRSQLEGFQQPPLLFKPPVEQCEANTICDVEINLQKHLLLSDISMPTAIYASWALAISQLTSSNDVSILLTLSGRNAPVAEIEAIVGPILTTVPLRVKIDPSQSAKSLLLALESQSRAMIAHEQCSLDHIRSLSPSARAACDLALGMTVNPYNHHKSDIGTGIGLVRPLRMPMTASPSPFFLDCAVSEYGVDALAMFDDRIVNTDLIRNLMAAFESNLQNFTEGSGDILLKDFKMHSDLLEANNPRLSMVPVGTGLGYDPLTKVSIDIETAFSEGGVLENGFTALDAANQGRRGLTKSEHGQYLK